MRGANPLAPRDARISPPRSSRRRRNRRSSCSFYRNGPRGGRRLRARHPIRVVAHARGSAVPLSIRARARGACRRRRLPHWRLRARVAPVVFPLEQHSGRRVARARREGTARRPGSARGAGRAHARGRALGGARREFREPMADAARARRASCRRIRISTRILRAAIRRETELLVRRLVREPRSVLTLLDADYTYLERALAAHYGVDRRARQPHAARRVAGRTARGAACSATAAFSRRRRRRTARRPSCAASGSCRACSARRCRRPPPGAEADLSAEASESEGLVGNTVRERLELHRANPTCAAATRIMDPLGSALENFDLLGRWRDSEDGHAIDACGADGRRHGAARAAGSARARCSRARTCSLRR